MIDEYWWGGWKLWWFVWWWCWPQQKCCLSGFLKALDGRPLEGAQKLFSSSWWYCSEKRGGHHISLSLKIKGFIIDTIGLEDLAKDDGIDKFIAAIEKVLI